MVDLAKRNLFKRATLSRNKNDSFPLLPWLRSPDTFTDLCTRCGQCMAHCDTQIIIKGDGGFPTVDFTIDECSFCYQCAKNCPENLFLEEEQWPWQIKAKITEQCLSQQNIECRSCGDSCEVQAIQFKLSAGRVAQPQIELDNCTGCGACVSICPTQAIKVSTAQAESALKIDSALQTENRLQTESDHYATK